MRFLLPSLAALTLLNCGFQPDLSGYPPCTESGVCAPGCVCLGGQVCVPEDRENRDMLPSMCDPVNTCGADLANDPENCGECGHVCQFEHAEAYCEQGVCRRGDCDPGWDNCGQPNNPGCPDSLDEPRYCGDCGTHCGGDTPYCEDRVCVWNCDLPKLECDGQCIDPEDNDQHCGTCFNDCTQLPNVDSADCIEGECVILDCTDGFDSCDGMVSSGCESPLGTKGNCAHCHDSCNDINGTGECIQGACVFVCVPGYAHCEEDSTRGCETELGTDENCTACGDDCTAKGMVCGESGCVGLSCSYPYDDCGTGECVNLLEDPQHCSECGKACAGNVPCIGGLCGGEGLYCDETPCPEGRCCVVSGSAICFSGDCDELVDAELHCNSAVDCGAGQVCCMMAGAWHPSASCSENCELQESVLCATDQECFSAPGGPYEACCPSSSAPEAYNICSESPCPN